MNKSQIAHCLVKTADGEGWQDKLSGWIMNSGLGENLQEKAVDNAVRKYAPLVMGAVAGGGLGAVASGEGNRGMGGMSGAVAGALLMAMISNMQEKRKTADPMEEVETPVEGLTSTVGSGVKNIIWPGLPMLGTYKAGKKGFDTWRGHKLARAYRKGDSTAVNRITSDLDEIRDRYLDLREVDNYKPKAASRLGEVNAARSRFADPADPRDLFTKGKGWKKGWNRLRSVKGQLADADAAARISRGGKNVATGVQDVWKPTLTRKAFTTLRRFLK